MKPFIINRHGRIVLPSSFFPELDFATFDTFEHFLAVIMRDFAEKAPTDSDIVNRLQDASYSTRYEVCRDLALNLFWVNRYALTMYEKRPTRWRDLPKRRDDVFLPAFKPWDAAEFANTMSRCYRELPASWDEEVEEDCFQLLLRAFRARPSAGDAVRAIKPTVAETMARPGARTCQLQAWDADYPSYDYQEVIDYAHPVPELEALMRQAMILHNQYRWDPAAVTWTEVTQLKDDDIVLAYYPRTPEVLNFIRRVKNPASVKPDRWIAPRTPALAAPVRPLKPIVVRERFALLPKIESIAVYKGEVACTNADLIRNHAYCWSRMTQEEITDKTGIQERCYSELSLEAMALITARRALEKAGRRPEEVGAVLFCSCTSTRPIPSVACWLSGELGILQTHASCDIVAACAGMPYGFAEATRILQEVERPVLVVCAEKFSDKIGTVRPSRMIFGDGAAAVVIAPVREGESPDLEVIQTYASGPWSEVNSIIWPNPEFGNNITVYGPEVKALVQRYLRQMSCELNELRNPDNPTMSMMSGVDLIVPHQANKSMVTAVATAAGLRADQLYFNIERVGNTSAASILIAIHDAVLEKRIDRPMRVFAPGFGAGAVAGYLVMRVDPAWVTTCTAPQVSQSRNSTGLEGRVALVIGESHAVSQAVAEELARRGAHVAVNFRSGTNGSHAPGLDPGISLPDCLILEGDPAHKEDARRMLEQVLRKWQRLDILVNSPGVMCDKPLRETADDEWEAVISANLNSIFNATSAALPAMMNQRFGRIINISSTVAQSGVSEQADNSATAGAVIAFTKTVALESARYNITANAIAPGYISEETLQTVPEPLSASIKANIPLGRFANSKDVAKLAGFLAADADYVTGQVLSVNGGYQM